jgi:hypothetical protein
VQKSKHKQRQEEEVELLGRTKVDEELKRVERKRALNIQPLAISSSSHSSSSSECAEAKEYNEKISFAQMIIHDIDTIGTSTTEFLHKSE